MTVTEEDALRAYAKMLNSLTVGTFADYLANDFVYESQSVIAPLTSKAEFLDYIETKLKTFAKKNAPVFAEMGMVSAYGRINRPCVVVAQYEVDNLVSLVLGEIADNKLKRLDLCEVPSPHTAKRSGEYPR